MLIVLDFIAVDILKPPTFEHVGDVFDHFTDIWLEHVGDVLDDVTNLIAYVLIVFILIVSVELGRVSDRLDGIPDDGDVSKLSINHRPNRLLHLRHDDSNRLGFCLVDQCLFT